MSTLTVPQIIGANMRAIRARYGWTRHEFADHLTARTGMTWTESVVYQAERVGRRFPAHELVAVAHALDVSVPELLALPAEYEGAEIAATCPMAADEYQAAVGVAVRPGPDPRVVQAADDLDGLYQRAAELTADLASASIALDEAAGIERDDEEDTP